MNEAELYTTSDTENRFNKYKSQVEHEVWDFILEKDGLLGTVSIEEYDNAMNYPLIWDCFDNNVSPDECAYRALKWVDFTFGNYTA